jgi:hypothetical protein
MSAVGNSSNNNSLTVYRTVFTALFVKDIEAEI